MIITTYQHELEVKGKIERKRERAAANREVFASMSSSAFLSSLR
jgi:hypothetical protein